VAAWLARLFSDYGAGSLVQTYAGGGALLAYTNDTTVIELKENTIVRVLRARRGKRFELLSGVMEIKAAPQPPGRPLRVLTPNAEVKVLGTTLSLAASGKSTRVDVAQGQVTLETRATGQTTLVSQHQRAVASINHPVTTELMRPITNHFGAGSILREYWLNARGMTVQDLLSDTNFPDHPAGRETLTTFEMSQT